MSTTTETLSSRLARIGGCASGVKWLEPFGFDARAAYEAIQKEQHGGDAIARLAGCLLHALPDVDRQVIEKGLELARDARTHTCLVEREPFDDAFFQVSDAWDSYRWQDPRPPRAEFEAKHAEVEAKAQYIVASWQQRKAEICAEYTEAVCALLPLELLLQLLRQFELLPKEERHKYRMR
jgi:hypothetical protein